MNDTNTLQNVGYLKNLLFENLIKAVAKATYIFGFTSKQFISSYRLELVKEGKRRNLKSCDIATQAGLDRRFVYKNKDKPIEKQTSHDSVRFDIISKLYEFQKQVCAGEPIPIKDFNNIIRNTRDGMIINSPRSFLKLITSDVVGCAVDLGTHIDIKSPCLNQLTNTDEICEFYSANSLRYIETIEHNINNSDKLLERFVSTTQIPTNKHKRVNKTIFDISLKALKDVKNILVENETQVEKGTYPEVGAHFVQFFSQPEDTHEKHRNNNTVLNLNKL